MVRQYKAVITSTLLFLVAANTQLANNRITAGGHRFYTLGQIATPSVKRDWLLNELQLMVLSHPGTGTVTVHLRINSGAMFDLAGKGGLADITAGMLLRGAKGLAAKDLTELVSQLGLSVNVKVGWDSTDITVAGPATGLESILDVLARLVIAPTFGQNEFDSLKAARSKELSGEKSNPMDVARETAIETLYGRYPLGRPVHGTSDSISKISRNDVVYYHDRFYNASDAELVVEGDVTTEEVTKLARSQLGIWKKGEKVPATFLPPEAPSSRRILVVDRPESSDSSTVVAGLGISRRAKDYLASAVMTQLLNASVARSTSGAASGVRTNLEARYLAGPLLVEFVSPADKAATAVQTVIDAMERLRAGDIPPEELEQAKQKVITSYAQDTATSEGQMTALLDIEQYGLGRDYLLNFAARVAAVRADEVKSAAQKHLSPQSLVVSAVGPAASLSVSLKKLGQVSVVGGQHTF